ncbi:MAG: TolC family protein, partial [Elusimicrobia bacterium]|nr:TolC family protein [Elusimicrobiota bacterium]
MTKSTTGRFVLALCSSLALATGVYAAKNVTVSVVMDGPSPQWDAVKAVFLEDLVALTEQEFVIQAPASKQFDGGWDSKKIDAALKKAEADPKTDVVLVLGFAASQQAAMRKNFPKATFVPFAMNALGATLPRKGSTSGVANFNYLSTETKFPEVLKFFQSVVPFRRAAIVLDKALLQSLAFSGKVLVDQARAIGVDLRIVSHSGEPNLVDKIPKDIQVVIVAPLPRLKQANRPALIDGLIKRKLPSFSLSGDAEVAEGLLLSKVSSVDLSQRTRQTALNILAVLRGARAGDQTVVFDRKLNVTVNMATARALDVPIRWSVLREATLLNEEPESFGPPLSISAAALEAVQANLDIIAGQLGVQAGAKEVSRVRSVLFPQLEGNVDYQFRRDYYPVVKTGLAAEKTLDASLRLNQILFSESALANLSVQKKLQVALEAQQRTLELDVVQQAVNTYLNVLKARTQLDVEKNGLRLAQSNLQLAKSRVAAGKADASDVSRWESEIATARQRVLSARAGSEQFRDKLNRLLRRPLKDRFPLQPAGLDDPQLLISRPNFFKTVDSDRAFRIMTEFFVQEGLTLSPDVAELDARVQAEERQLSSEKVGSFLPELSVWGEGYRVLKDNRTSVMQVEDLNDWRVGANLRIPILEGGGRMAAISQSRFVLDQLKAQRDSVRQNVEQSVRDSLHALQASVPSIRLAQDGAEAARRTYSLVSKNYARGTRSVVDLLDAQNTSLQADLAASTAVYAAMTDLMNLQRSVGSFNYLAETE